MDDRTGSQKGADEGLSRRDFAVFSAAAGIAAGGAAKAAAVEEAEVEVKTADGVCDAVLARPAGKGAWPAALVFPDALGLRPVFRDMGKRLAGEGYVVLTVNQFYRSAKAPVFTEAPTDFSPQGAFMKRLMELRGPLTSEAVMRDGDAFIRFLDTQPAVNKAAKAGVSGYCMGGPMTIQASAARPDRFGAAASFHGGGLVTDKPDSPHLLAPKTRAAFYFAVAQNDDEKEPQTKVKLKEAFDAAGRSAKIEVFQGAMHGWCVAGSPVYKADAAERAWSEMLALYKKTLV